MSLVDRVAAAMYNAPDPSEPEAENAQWPPFHPDDRAWWITRAQAAVRAMRAELLDDEEVN